MSSLGRAQLGKLPVVNSSGPILDKIVKARERAYIKVVAQAFTDIGMRPAFGCALARHESLWNPLAANHTGGDAKRGGSYGICQMSMTTAVLLGYQGQPAGLQQAPVCAALAAKLCLQNQERVPASVVRDEDNLFWAWNMACLYNSGHLWQDAPRFTREKYAPAVVAHFLWYQDIFFLAGFLGKS